MRRGRRKGEGHDYSWEGLKFKKMTYDYRWEGLKFMIFTYDYSWEG